MKKIFSVLTLFAMFFLLFGFVSCSGSDSTDDTSAFSVGDKSFSTLAEAVAYLSSTDKAVSDVTYVIIMLKDTTDPGATISGIDKNIRLDFQGYTFTLASGGVGIVVDNEDGEVEISGGKILVQEGSTLSNDAVITTKSSVTITGTTLDVKADLDAIETTAGELVIEGTTKVTTTDDRKVIKASSNSQIAVKSENVVLTGGLSISGTAAVDLGEGTFNLTSNIEKEDGAFLTANQQKLKPQKDEVKVDDIVLHEHTWNEGVVTVQAGCETTGMKTYTCTACHKTKTETIEATGHDFSNPVWSWADDKSYAKVTFTCQNDNSHVKVIDATVTSEITTEPTCTAVGTRTYTATATFNDTEYTDSVTVDIEMVDHTYESVVTEPTATEEGYTTHTCSVCNYSYKDNIVPPVGYEFGEPTWNWADDHLTVKAIFKATNADNYSVEQEGSIETTTTAATCGVAGNNTYTATVNFNNETYTDTVSVEIPATGQHTFGSDAVCTVCGTLSSDAVTVSFDANGGSGSMADVTVLKGANVSVPPSCFTAPSGKLFDGWNTVADGSGIKYVNGDSITVPSSITSSSITLYAQWKVETEYSAKDTPLTLEFIEAGTLSFNNPRESLQYSKNGGARTAVSGDIPVVAGDVICLFAEEKEQIDDKYFSIQCTSDCYVYGNVMSLLNPDDYATDADISVNSALKGLFEDNTHVRNHGTKELILPATTLYEYCYYGMFSGCTGLTEAPELPATILTYCYNCYASMFAGCTGLTEAPELPAKTLVSNCYASMFAGCTGLTEAPELPATILESCCYEYMFKGCTGLTAAPELPAMTLANDCYASMFAGCTGLEKAPELPAVTLADFCYGNMFYGCTGLTAAPELPATTLAPICYASMFKGCTGLTAAPELPAETLVSNCYATMFAGCTGLTAAPELPAETLADRCYLWMFAGCTGLTEAPELPAKTLAEYCYCDMFYGCTGLTAAPELPAMTLADRCYSWMFYGCTGLEKAPELPAVTLAEGCYEYMFYGCTGLIEAPELPAVTLADRCYASMFAGCTGLEKAPELPATILTVSCYSNMFLGCTGLTEAPELPAETLVKSCYHRMFDGCEKLKNVTCLATDISAFESTAGWLFDVASVGTFKKAYNMNDWKFNSDGIPFGWKIISEEAPGPVAVTSISLDKQSTTIKAGYTDTLTATISPDNATDKAVTWTSNNTTVATVDSDGTVTAVAVGTATITAEAGDKSATCTVTVPGVIINASSISLSVGGTGTLAVTNTTDSTVTWSSSDENVATVSNGTVTGIAAGTAKITAKAGNYTATCTVTVSFGKEATPLSLEFIEAGTLSFNNPRESLQYSKNGGARTAVSGDITVKKGDVISLFAEGETQTYDKYLSIQCTSDCYVYGNVMSILDPVNYATDTDISVAFALAGLFKDNTFIKNHGTKELILPATTLSVACYYEMFYGCTGLTAAPELPATTLAVGCYYEMFAYCTNLSEAPELPAETLADSCYNGMFHDCRNLTGAPELPAETLADRCYFGMFCRCTNLTEAPELPATTLADNCYNYMFQGCEKLTVAPKLPATTLAYRCYFEMFFQCTGLTEAPELPATTLAENCYELMFLECKALEKAPKLPAPILVDSCYRGMFTSCYALESITCLATTNINSNSLGGWLDDAGINATGKKFYRSSETAYETWQSYVLESDGWTIDVYNN